MDERCRTRFSKFLSLVLRHRPETIGIRLDEAGWVDVECLLAQCNKHGKALSLLMLEEIVTTSPKQRFAFSEDNRRIRANQGHSVEVRLGHERTQPPPFLYHGTVKKYLSSIRKLGLRKMKRHHVHLSSDFETASTVSQRRGKAIVLVVRAAQMDHDGHQFFVSANGVWLTDNVPCSYIDFPES